MSDKLNQNNNFRGSIIYLMAGSKSDCESREALRLGGWEEADRNVSPKRGLPVTVPAGAI